MAYLTRDEIEAQFGSDTFDGVSDELWTSVLSSVDGLISSYIGDIDLENILAKDRDMLKQTALWVARYELQDFLPYDEVMDSAWQKRYSLALDRLKMMASGKLRSPAQSSTPVLISSARRGWGEFG